MPQALGPQSLVPSTAAARERIWAVMHELGSQCEEETELLWSLLGLVFGGVATFWLLFELGKVRGLSGPGITSGLAAAGAVVDGGMLAGLVLLILPPALAAIAGYALARRTNRSRAAGNSAEALAKLRALRRELMARPEYFAVELESLEVLFACVRVTGDATPGEKGSTALFFEKIRSRA